MSEARLAAAQRWVLRVAVLGLPIVYSPWTYDSYVLPKLAAARAVLVVLAVLHMARRGHIRRTALDVAWLVFLGSAALSTLFAVNVNVAVFGTYSRYDGLLTLVLYAGLYWIAAQTIESRAEARTVIRFLLAGAYAAAAIAIIQSLRDSIGTGSVAPAYGTLGNPNVLGAYLGMALPLALAELLRAVSATARVIAANVVVVVGVALLFSLSRSAWVAAWVGCAIVIATGNRPPLRLAAYVGAWVLAISLVVAVAGIGGGSVLVQRLETRASALFDPGSSRTGIWRDSLRLIESRPVLGVGPDNVGLVFTDFQSGDWGLAAGHIRQPIDKTHAELLQIAATQGLAGLAADAFMLYAFARTFWRSRRTEFALPCFAGLLAYELALQVNFTALSSAIPFWLFAAAAVVIWGGQGDAAVVRPSRAAALLGVPVVGLILVVGAVLPMVADANLKTAVDDDFAGRPEKAAPIAAAAAKLQPQEAVYATEVANLAFERGDSAGARTGYLDAARLGTFNDLVYRNLALADQTLGLTDDARAAARRAVELNPYDPANQALLAQLA